MAQETVTVQTADGTIVTIISNGTPVITPPVVTPPVVAPPLAIPELPALTAVGSGQWATAWAQGILTALGAPINAATVASLISWFEHEDDNQPQGHQADGAGRNNPLNVTPASGTFAGTTGTEPSGAGPGHPGNYNFDTPAHGCAATAAVIKSYGPIASALKAGTSLIGNSAVSAALSEWSGGGYSSL